MQKSILIVEDDSDINALLKRILENEGFSVTQAFSGTEAMMHFEKELPILMILDLMLPGLSGEEVLKKVRDDFMAECPVIIISAKSGLKDKVTLLDVGADDYITKPFEPMEVVARVRAALRRMGAPAVQNTILTYKKLSMNVELHKVSVAGEEISLTAKEYDILRVLLENPEKVYSKEHLYELIWQEGYYGAAHTVSVHISNLRKKIKQLDPDEGYIQSVYGIGFRLEKS
ncbi:MAG: response regulator transcription factor [Peptococcaceae bacterium]